MTHALTFNRSVQPRRKSPVFHPPVDRAVVRRVFERLNERALPRDEGPFRDKGTSLTNLLERIGPLLRRNVNDALASALFFLTPRGMEIPNLTFEPEIDKGVPDIVYDLEHIHATDNPLSAGELVNHSNLESRREITVAVGEELYLLIAALFRRVGLQANLALLRESSGQLSSALCVIDPESSRLASFSLPVHPAITQIVLYTDVEVQALTQLLKALNHMKKIREVGRTGAYRSLASDAVIGEFDEADAVLSLARQAIDHPLANVVASLREDLDVIRREVAASKIKHLPN